MRSEAALCRALLPAAGTVLCAVSGGADSVCLLDLLRREKGLFVVCAHYNHGLRGAASDRDETFVRDLCEKWGIPFVTERGNAAAWAEKRGLGLEAACRDLRYAFLERAAESCGASCVATAHTLNDNAETVLLQLSRGAGLRGLGGIPPERGLFVRPLLGVSRRQIEEYLEKNNIPHVEDETNQTDDFARNRVRHHVLPALEALRPGAAERIGAMTRLLREDEEYLRSLAEKFLETQKPGRLDIKALLLLPLPVSRRVLRIACGGGLEAGHVAALLALAGGADPSAACDVPGGRVRREYDQLVLFEAPPAGALRERVLSPGETALPEAGLAVRADLLPGDCEIHSKLNTFFFSYGKICGKLLLTPRREGDSLTLLGRAGTRSVKKLMIEKRIPKTLRALTPVLRDQAGVLAVYGVGQAERAGPAPGEEILRIEIYKTGGEWEV